MRLTLEIIGGDTHPDNSFKNNQQSSSIVCKNKIVRDFHLKICYLKKKLGLWKK